MPDLATIVANQRAGLLAEVLHGTVEELRLIDPGDIIGYIRAGQWANIADLVQSSAELSFRDDTLLFGCSADFTLDWSSAPDIALDMEFRGDGVSAFFTLLLGQTDATVALHHVWFALEPPTAAAGTAVFSAALARACRTDHAGLRRPWCP